jgi:carbon storage regulator CsrA
LCRRSGEAYDTIGIDNDLRMSQEPECQEDGMLVLSRKRSQQVTIGPDIRITIVKLDRNQVRLGIEAPRGVTVLRAELLARDDAENGSAQMGNEWPRVR